MKHLASLSILALVAGCSMEPKYIRPAPAVPTGWPAGDPALKASEADLAKLSYREIFRDPKLQAIIAQGLSNSQDLRRALANVEAARGLYRVQRAALLPSVDGAATGTERDGPAIINNASFSANLSAAFEIDLFGRLRSQSAAALDTYFSTEAAARATRLTLVADIASAYFTLATDRSLLAIAKQTEDVASHSVTLTQARLRGGVAPRTDLRQAETVLATAQSDRANLTTIVAQDRNALDLLVGQPVADSDLPASIESVDSLVSAAPAGLDSNILLRRPDVLQAEYLLRAANARIGAARAAFFPRISLTALAGFASTALTSLFSGDAFTWSAGPSASLPIFDGGANRGNLANAKAQRDALEASYQAAIQAAFRDVANALAREVTIGDQMAAQEKLASAAADTAMLTDARYRGGVDSFLSSLDAQRTLYSARRSLASTRLTRANNLVEVYRALGGDELADIKPR